MSYIQTAEDKKDAHLLHQLLEGDLSEDQAQSILNHTFSDLIKWTFDDVMNHLVEVFKFSPIQAEKLIEKYPIHIPDSSPPLKMTYPLPTFEKNSQRAKDLAQNFWSAKRLLKDAKGLLSKTTLYPADYLNNEDFESALAEGANINDAFGEISRFINSHLENVHQQIQGKG